MDGSMWMNPYFSQYVDGFANVDEIHKGWFCLDEPNMDFTDTVPPIFLYC